MQRTILLSSLALGALFSIARADVRMPPIFGDHMLLQQAVKTPVYGTADPGEKVTVTIAGQTASATADANGAWSVRLDPLPVTDKGVELTVSGANRLVFNDVLVGDVWLASGQSNMEYGVNYVNDSAQVIAASENPQIRLFTVAHRLSFTPVSDFVGKWIVCTPADLKKENFSGVAYFFAREIQEQRKIPVGVIGCYWGSSSLQAWCSAEALRASPDGKHQLDRAEQLAASLPASKEKYDKELLPAYEAAHRAWDEAVNPAYRDELGRWGVEYKKALDTKTSPPPYPKPPQPEPIKPRFEGDNNQTATVLFNGMLAPVFPYAIKGVLWYQGESNSGYYKQYAEVFPNMVSDWRRRWGLGDIPFLWVQLPGWEPGEWYPLFREVQRQLLSVPNTGMAVAIDVGEEKNVHPSNKLDVGHRLALAARGFVYGEKIVGSGPMFERMQKEGDKVRLFFKSVGGGLVIGSNPSGRAGVPPAPSADHLEGFEAAGVDGKFIPAKAKIDGETVVVSAEGVTDPMMVRYGWKPFPTVNLYNKDGLPAPPFEAK